MGNYKCSICGKEIGAKNIEVFIENEILNKDELWCDSTDCFIKANKKNKI